MSIWQDVRMQRGAAQEAISSLLRAARDLEQLQATRHELGAAALGSWTGPHRDTAQLELDALTRETAALVDALRRAAVAVAEEDAAAVREQRRREEARLEARRQAELGGIAR